MNYADNRNKFVVIVNRSVTPARLLNAVAHCCGGLAEQVGAMAEFLDYPSPASEWTAKISRWLILVFAAKNSEQIARFVRESTEENISLNCFTAAMVGESACQQQAQVAADTAPEYWVAAAFGEATVLRAKTRRFSLYRTE